MIAMIRGALTLQTATYAEFKAVPDVFRRGFVIVLIVGLVIGVVLQGAALIQELTGPPPAVRVREFERGMEEALNSMSAYMQMDQQSRQIFMRSMGEAVAIVREIAVLPTVLPRPVRAIFQAVAQTIEMPFSLLATLMGYGVLVHIVALILGGKGSIQQMLGVTSLAMIPRVADAFGFVPCVGALIGLLGLAWAAVMYVKATSVVHEVSVPRAVVAVILPAVVLLGVVALLLLFVIFVIIVPAIGSISVR